MLMRFLAALALGALVGLEREFVGKEAGVRTLMLVSGGAAMFTLIALTVPYLMGNAFIASQIISGGSGFLIIIANIVTGAGFLGAGIIIKTQEHVHGLTTATMMWATAAIGILVGLGQIQFAALASVIITVLLYVFRNFPFSREESRPRR